MVQRTIHPSAPQQPQRTQNESHTDGYDDREQEDVGVNYVIPTTTNSATVVPDQSSPSRRQQQQQEKQRQQQGCRGYVLHVDPHHTTEGLGSHMRGTVYPLLHIAACLNMIPILDHGPFWTNHYRDYSSLQLGTFLGIRVNNSGEDAFSEGMQRQQEEQIFLKKFRRVLEVNTWSDPTIGSACGDTVQLCELLQEYLQGNENDSLAPSDDDDDDRPPFLVYLTGALRYMNPTPAVYEFLQDVSETWMTHAHHKNNDNKNEESQTALCIAAHVRTPESFCSQGWKDDNHIDKLIMALETIQKQVLVPFFQIDEGQQQQQQQKMKNTFAIQIFSDPDFRPQDQEALLRKFPQAVIHVGTTETVLDDIREMAMAHIFLPASSHFSAMAGYFSKGVLVLSDPSRMEYFQPHKDLGAPVLTLEEFVETFNAGGMEPNTTETPRPAIETLLRPCWRNRNKVSWRWAVNKPSEN